MNLGDDSGADVTRSILTTLLKLHYKHDAEDHHNTDFNPGMSDDPDKSTEERYKCGTNATSDSAPNYVLLTNLSPIKVAEEAVDNKSDGNVEHPETYKLLHPDSDI